jgi:NTP pyrophosphatase (non-canonical NTP hydrolase)
MKMPKPELLAGLAEEAAELAQAALKLRRVLDGSNPTPTPQDEAEAHLMEEIADVTLYISTLEIDYSKVSDIMLSKQARWEERLKGR